jgi:ribosomal peptide maturation radical SAM protein 1
MADGVSMPCWAGKLGLIKICGHGANEPVKLTRFGGTVTTSEVIMDEVPLPDYSDYFDRITKSSLHKTEIWLPYEAARGCWWGAKSLCTFCAAVAENWSFRAKSPSRVLADLKDLAQRYGKRSIWFVDNIMDERYFSDVFPFLKESPVSMFVEMRAHTTKDNLKIMKDAGVVMVQPGIESLSTTVLGLMKKGTNAIMAVRTIKWCAEMGISAFYNFIYGFPQEPEAEYQRMADTVLSLTHLQPPNAPYRLRLDRFSVYYRDPEASGISILGPSPFRQSIYDLPREQLLTIEPSMVFSYKDGREPDDYIVDLAANCALWRDQWVNNFRRLSWHRNESGIRIYDTRSNTADKVYELGEIEAIAYLTCDAGATPAMVLESLPAEKRDSCSVEQIRHLLLEMTQLRLMFADGARFLSLAVEGDDRLIEAHKQKGALAFQPLRIPSTSEFQIDEAPAFAGVN